MPPDSFLDYAVTPGATNFGTNNSNLTGLQVYLLVSGVALAATVFPTIKVATPSRENDTAWLNFTCDDGAGVGVPMYLNASYIGGINSPPAPDPVAVVPSTAQAIWVPAGVEWQRRFAVSQEFRVIQNSGSNAYLRVELVSLSR